MADSIHLSEKSRQILVRLRQDVQDAQQAAAKAQNALAAGVTLTLDTLGLDTSLNHGIDFDKGIITPAEVTKPTPIREEAPAEASG